MYWKSIIKKLLFISPALFFPGINKAQTYRNGQADLLYRFEASTGEGAMWHPERRSLFWVDIEGGTLYEYFPHDSSCSSWLFGGMVSTVVPESDSTVIVSLQNEIVRINVDNDIRESIAIVDDQCGSLRCNDGKCDPNGRFWIGTMTLKQQTGVAALYRLDDNGNLPPQIENVTISNGLVWSADQKYMYYIDTPSREVKRYKYDSNTGDIEFDGIAVVIPKEQGVPDGMCIDTNGNLWIAHWGGYGVYCWDPQTGELLCKITVPAPNVASCTFGGKHQDILYITTARSGLSPEQLKQYPLSGSVFSYKPGVTGPKTHYYKPQTPISIQK